MFFSRRGRGGPDLHLDWKVRIFFAGALMAFIGMVLDSSILVMVAIAVLLMGILLRFLPSGDGGGHDGEEGGSAEGDG